MPFPTAIKNTLLGALPSSVLLALFNGDPTSGGVEVTGSGYVRKAGTLAAASGGERRLAADVNFGYSTGSAWTTATYLAVYDSSGTTLQGYAPLSTSFTGDSLRALLLVAGSTDLRLRITDS